MKRIVVLFMKLGYSSEQFYESFDAGHHDMSSPIGRML